MKENEQWHTQDVQPAVKPRGRKRLLAVAALLAALLPPALEVLGVSPELRAAFRLLVQSV